MHISAKHRPRIEMSKHTTTLHFPPSERCRKKALRFAVPLEAKTRLTGDERLRQTTSCELAEHLRGYYISQFYNYSLNTWYILSAWPLRDHPWLGTMPLDLGRCFSWVKGRPEQTIASARAMPAVAEPLLLLFPHYKDSSLTPFVMHLIKSSQPQTHMPLWKM